MRPEFMVARIPCSGRLLRERCEADRSSGRAVAPSALTGRARRRHRRARHDGGVSSSTLIWYTARAAGIVTWALLAASVLWGLALSTRVLRGRPRPAWLLDLHRFLGGAAIAFLAVHVG